LFLPDWALCSPQRANVQSRFCRAAMPAAKIRSQRVAIEELEIAYRSVIGMMAGRRGRR
jgi:hypothetical protein